MVKYQQLKEYMKDKTRIILTDPVNEALKGTKTIHGFESDSETVAYLINMEEMLRSSKMIKKTAKCEICDNVLMLDQLKIPRKCTHWHIERGDCHGKLVDIKYGITEPKTEPKNATETKDEHSGTTDAKDEHSGTTDAKDEPKEIMTKEEKAEFLRKYNAGEV